MAEAGAAAPPAEDQPGTEERTPEPPAQEPAPADTSPAGYVAVVSCRMGEPYFVEDSDFAALAPLLAETVGQLEPSADQFDLLMAFFIALMAEKGYRASCLYNQHNKTWDKNATCIPSDWKRQGENVYELNFVLHTMPDICCQLIGIPIGDWMVLNLLFKRINCNCRARSITVNVANHVNIHLKELGRFWHLKKLAYKFKEDLLGPLHAEMIMEVGVAAPCLQGLPDVAKRIVFQMLDLRSKINLRKACEAYCSIT